MALADLEQDCAGRDPLRWVGEASALPCADLARFRVPVSTCRGPFLALSAGAGNACCWWPRKWSARGPSQCGKAYDPRASGLGAWNELHRPPHRASQHLPIARGSRQKCEGAIHMFRRRHSVSCPGPANDVRDWVRDWPRRSRLGHADALAHRP
jgi:hypothetical protein